MVLPRVCSTSLIQREERQERLGIFFFFFFLARERGETEGKKKKKPEKGLGVLGLCPTVLGQETHSRRCLNLPEAQMQMSALEILSQSPSGLTHS